LSGGGKGIGQEELGRAVGGISLHGSQGLAIGPQAQPQIIIGVGQVIVAHRQVPVQHETGAEHGPVVVQLNGAVEPFDGSPRAIEVA
jgi:hypothetical protein